MRKPCAIIALRISVCIRRVISIEINRHKIFLLFVWF